jgi:hypothetical protein
MAYISAWKTIVYLPREELSLLFTDCPPQYLSFCFGPSAWPATSPDLTPLRYLPWSTQRTRSIGKTAAASYGVRWRRQGIRWSCEEDDRGRIVHVEWRRALWTVAEKWWSDWTDGFVPCCDTDWRLSVAVLSDTQCCTYRRARLSCFVLLSVTAMSVCLYSTYCTMFVRNHVRAQRCNG